MQKIYLLPGLMTDERLWSRVKPLLDNDYELVFLSIPLVSTFQEVCKELDKVFSGEDKINLLGFSLGSYIASYYAIQNPKKIAKLFLVAGSASFIDENEVLKRKQVLEQMQSFGFNGLSNKKVLTLIEKKNYEDIELIDIIKKMYKQLGFDVYKKQMELSFKRVDISKELSSLSVPVKLFYSSNDRLFDYKALEKIKSMNSRNIVFTQRLGESHMIPLEDPKRLVIEIKEWMES